MAELKIPEAILDAARIGADDAGTELYQRVQQETREAPTVAQREAARIEGAVRAAFLAAARLYPASPAPPPLPLLPGYAERFREAAYTLAGPRPPLDGHGQEPEWPVDLFEVERRAAHQEQPTGNAPLVQPAE